MPLKLINVHKSKNLYMRGTLCGVYVYETTKTSSLPHAEGLLAKRESEILGAHLLSKGININKIPPLDKFGNPKAATQHLYRHYSANGDLLYIGISTNALWRLGQHRQDCKWFTELYLVKVEHFYSREEVMEAEKEAIRRERPKYNIVHNKGKKS